MIHLKNIEYLVGTHNIMNIPLQAYSDEAVDFASQLSKKLMKSPALRNYPDIAALAFWCRKANLQRMKEQCPEATNRLGRGLCFHIAPGNIPINFAFSYMFGLFAGCANIVRLSSRQFPQIKPVCDTIAETLTICPEIEKRTAFVRYPADDETTAAFCEIADARVIWGGDDTIAKLRSMPAKPRCIDVCFADRYSFCIVDGRAVLDADEKTMARLAEGFYNDTYLMDQNACSSQQLILWQNDSKVARTKFWDAVVAYAEKKYPFQAAIGMDKYAQVLKEVLDGKPVSDITHATNLLYRVELAELKDDLTELRGKGGYFYEYAAENLQELAPFVNEKFQTVTYFGVEPQKIRRFVINNKLRGIDRIVPIGKAMDIGIMWDGYDLVRVLSRLVETE